MARIYVDAVGDEDPPPDPPSMVYYTPEVQALSVIADWLQSIAHLQSSERQSFRPYPRPETAVTRIRREMSLTRMRGVMNKLRPKARREAVSSPPTPQAAVAEVAAARPELLRALGVAVSVRGSQPESPAEPGPVEP